MWRRLLDPGDWLGVKPALDPAAPSLALEHAPSPGEVKTRIVVGLVALARWTR